MGHIESPTGACHAETRWIVTVTVESPVPERDGTRIDRRNTNNRFNRETAALSRAYNIQTDPHNTLSYSVKPWESVKVSVKSLSPVPHKQR